jgi:signal transduction histidine kinase
MLRADFGAGLDPTAAQWLEAALGSLERMRRLVQEILGYARAGARPADLAEVDLGVAVDAALRAVDIDGAAVARGPLPVVRSSEAELVEVLTQLLRNALTHGAGGGSPAEVRVSAVQGDDGAWIVSVEDDGPGVSERVRDRVFEPFERTSSGGAGLGLALARKLVEHLGGRLWLDGRAGEGGGAAFRFSIPPTLT